MTDHADMTTGPNERAATGAGTTGSPRRQFARPARMAATTAAVLAAGALVVGCGAQNGPTASPESVGGDAAPAGSSQSDGKDSKDSKDSKNAKNGKDADDHNGNGDEGGADIESKASGQYGSSEPGACTTSDLQAEVGPNHPGAGQVNFALVFTNKSAKSCDVRGFPGLAFLNSDDEQVSLNPERDGPGGKAVKLAPGKSAWAPLSFSNPQMTGVPTVTPETVLLTPPDQRAPLRVDWQGGEVTATGKASVPKIGALTPGTGG